MQKTSIKQKDALQGWATCVNMSHMFMYVMRKYSNNFWNIRPLSSSIIKTGINSLQRCMYTSFFGSLVTLAGSFYSSPVMEWGTLQARSRESEVDLCNLTCEHSGLNLLIVCFSTCRGNLGDGDRELGRTVAAAAEDECFNLHGGVCQVVSGLPQGEIKSYQAGMWKPDGECGGKQKKTNFPWCPGCIINGLIQWDTKFRQSQEKRF